MLKLAKQPRLGLYVHWPFCRAKCPYCDFNSHVSKDIDSAAWQSAYLRELDWILEQYQAQAPLGLSGRPKLQSIFFGGGTPSLMPPALIGAICDRAEHLFEFDDTIEITAEANPTSVETDKLAGFWAAGINRLSLGIQSLNKDHLSFLGREHSADEALHALQIAKGLFPKVSADMIYGMPDQTITSWMSDLHRLQSEGLAHLSAYQLTIEPGTIFYTRARNGETMRVSADHMADFYSATEQAMADAGLKGYEISNYAKAGSECQHNLLYWRAEDWLAIGPGAHARFSLQSGGRWQGATRRSPGGWLKQVASQNHGFDSIEIETPQSHGEEILMMGLRLAEGVCLSRLSRSSIRLDETWVKRFISENWLCQKGDRLIATSEGRQRLDYILGQILDADENSDIGQNLDQQKTMPKIEILD